MAYPTRARGLEHAWLSVLRQSDCIQRAQASCRDASCHGGSTWRSTRYPDGAVLSDLSDDPSIVEPIELATDAALGRQREPHLTWIDERGARHPRGFNSAGSVTSSGSCHSCAARSVFTYYPQGGSHAEWPNDRMTNMNTHRPRPVGSPAGRSQRWASSALRPEARGSHNARRNYDRYLALAQAELQAGDRVAAENYNQHAEHYFRLMSSDS